VHILLYLTYRYDETQQIHYLQWSSKAVHNALSNSLPFRLACWLLLIIFNVFWKLTFFSPLFFSFPLFFFQLCLLLYWIRLHSFLLLLLRFFTSCRMKPQYPISAVQPGQGTGYSGFVKNQPALLGVWIQ